MYAHLFSAERVDLKPALMAHSASLLSLLIVTNNKKIKYRFFHYLSIVVVVAALSTPAL
jgi:hypothetical protein